MIDNLAADTCLRYRYRWQFGYDECLNRYRKLTKPMEDGERPGLLSITEKKNHFFSGASYQRSTPDDKYVSLFPRYVFPALLFRDTAIKFSKFHRTTRIQYWVYCRCYCLLKILNAFPLYILFPRANPQAVRKAHIFLFFYQITQSRCARTHATQLHRNGVKSHTNSQLHNRIYSSCTYDPVASQGAPFAHSTTVCR